MIFILSLEFSYVSQMPLQQYVFKYSPPTIELKVPSNLEVKHSPVILELGYSNNSKTKACD